MTARGRKYTGSLVVLHGVSRVSVVGSGYCTERRVQTNHAQRKFPRRNMGIIFELERGCVRVCVRHVYRVGTRTHVSVNMTQLLRLPRPLWSGVGERETHQSREMATLLSTKYEHKWHQHRVWGNLGQLRTDTGSSVTGAERIAEHSVE